MYISSMAQYEARQNEARDSPPLFKKRMSATAVSSVEVATPIHQDLRLS